MSPALNEEAVRIYADGLSKLATGDLRNARQLVKIAAEADHLPALRIQALFVQSGVGGKPDPKGALRWLRRAAMLGDAASCMALANWRISRREVGQAKFWLKDARGDPRAMLMLARLYTRSRSVRATGAAKLALCAAMNNLRWLTAGERKEYDDLWIEYRNRNPDAIWSPHNQKNVSRSNGR